MLPNQKSSALGFALLLTTVAMAKPLESIFVPPTLAQAAPTAFPLPTSVPPGTTVQIDGSSSMAATNQALKQRFESQFSGSNINANYSGTPSGLEALRNGKVDLAAIGRPLAQAELDQGFIPVAVGRGKIALIVSPDNPFNGSITVPQFARVVRGEITDWAELGGAPGKIRFVDRPDLSDTRVAFRNYSVFIQTPYELGSTATRLGEDSTQAVAQQLGKDGLSFAPANQVLNQPSLRIVPMHNTLPTDPRYPFSQPFYYVHKANPSPGAAAFLGYATSEPGLQTARLTETDPASLALNPTTLLAAGSAAAGALNAGAGAGSSPSPTSAATGTTPGGIAGAPDGSQTIGAAPVNAGTSSNEGGIPGWLWWLLPLGIGALLLAWWLRRRSTSSTPETPVAPPPPTSQTPPPPPPPLMNPTETDGSLASRAGSVITSDRASIAEVQSPTIPPAAVIGGAALAGAGAAAVIRGQADSTQPPVIETGESAIETGESAIETGASVIDTQTPVIEPESPPIEPESIPVPDRPLVEIRELPSIETPTSAIEPPEAPPETGIDLPNGAILGGAVGLGAAGAAAWMTRTRSGELPPTDLTESEPLASLDEIEPLDEVEDAPLDQPPIELYVDDAPTVVDEISPIAQSPDVNYVQLNLDSTETPIETPEPTIIESAEPIEDPNLSQGVIPGLSALGGAAALGIAGVAASRTNEPDATPDLVETDPTIVEPPVETATVIEGSSSFEPTIVESQPELSEIDAGTDLETDEFAEIESQLGAVEPDTIAEEPPAIVEAGSVIPGIVALGGIGLAAGLVGDPNNTTQTDVEAARFDVGQTDLSSETLASVDEGLADLPDGYGESRIVLMPRDPQWAYAYWDVSNEHKSDLRNQGGQNLFLRLYDVTDVDAAHQSPHSLQQFECDEMARDWYLPIPVSDRDYLIEIGYLTADGRWLTLARSQPVRVPPAYPSGWEDDQEITIEWETDLRDQTFFTLASPTPEKPLVAAPDGMYDRIFDLSQGAELQRIAGSIFGSMQQAPTQSIRSLAFPSGVGMGGLPTASGISGMGMSGMGMSGVGMGAYPIRSRRFWLVADAELIIYGATEPDATVSIAGETIPLNPDGTFRFQMSFQDGLIDYPILAVAKDGDQTRSIHLKFNRETPSRNTNTKDEATDEWQS
ncbi:MAG: DUF4912 domain-containing protein [Plectolyngbya sp. WJT66-NPBG17]|jgi:ABC-type phosphate transport system substrate-binding protein|nr:DUF4912 domain-containing protein [Plectolyngbya sp. WJT66-NPBG17]